MKLNRSGISYATIFLFSTVFVISISSFSLSVEANSSVSIEFGETIVASIGEPGEVDTYTFNATANDTVLIRMSQGTSSINPKIELFSTSGTQIIDEEGYWSVEICNSLTESGTYTILASDGYGHETGSYSIFIQRLNNPINAKSIEVGTSMSGSLGFRGRVDTYTFTASADDIILLRMIPGTSSINPRIELFSPSSTNIGSITTMFSEEVELFNILSESGTYTILVSDNFGEETGSYSIFIQRLNNPINAKSIEVGTSMSGSIGIIGDIDTYTFTATTNDVVFISMANGDSPIGPHIELYSPSGTKIGGNEDYYYPVDIIHSLFENGTYTILASDSGRSNTGPYGIFIQRLNNPVNAKPIGLGTTMPGSLNVIGEIDTYTFTATTNDNIIIKMSTDEFIIMSVAIYSGDGGIIGTNWGYEEIEVTTTLQMSGIFTILAYSYEIGNYEILVNKLGNQLPICSLYSDISTGYAPLKVTFSMSASDNDGSINSWELDINNDGTADYSGSGMPPSTQQHIYQTEGTYTAKLTVTDNDGATDSDTRTITVNQASTQNQAPTAHFDDSKENLKVTFQDKSNDSDGYMTDWYWDFGDSTYSDLKNPVHTYEEEGSYNATLTVTDNNGDTDTYSKIITVSVEEDDETPGFEVILLVIALISMSMILLKKKLNRG